MRRLLGLLLPAIGLAIFAFIVHRTGVGRIAAILGAIRVRELVWAPFIVGAIAVARGARWRYVMRCVGIEYGLARSTGVFMIGFFASAITPAKAGDAVRALYVRHDTGRPLGEGLLTVFVDRMWDLGFVLVAGVASAVLFSHYYTSIPSAPLFIAGAIALAAALILMTRRTLVRAALRPAFVLLVPARYRQDMAQSFHTFYDALRAYGAEPRRALVMLGYTLVCWVIIFVNALYVAHLVNAPVSSWYIILIMPIVTLAELLPLSVSGLGTRDATVVFLFGVVGAGSAEAVGFSLLYMLIATYLTAIFGFVLWLRNPVRWQRTQSRP